MDIYSFSSFFDDGEEDIDKKNGEFPFELFSIFDDNEQNNEDQNIQSTERPLKFSQSNLIDRIKNELNVTPEEFQKFLQKLKKTQKTKKKETYKKTVMLTRNSGNEKRCTICNRCFLSLQDDAFVFEKAFYFFTFGKKFNKKFVTLLHNVICRSLGLRYMERCDSRAIRNYFEKYKNNGFEIIKEARNYLIEHPELRDEIINDKMKKLE